MSAYTYWQAVTSYVTSNHGETAFAVRKVPHPRTVHDTVIAVYKDVSHSWISRDKVILSVQGVTMKAAAPPLWTDQFTILCPGVGMLGEKGKVILSSASELSSLI